MAIDKTNWSIAAGIWWGLSVVFFALLYKTTGLAQTLFQLITEAYLGYGTSIIGLFLGFVWGFIDMFIGVWLLLFIYEQVKRLRS